MLMNTLIIKCLAELMHDHECVIIPEFGAFISNGCPARLDYAVHRLTPPTKELAFNAQLVSDDGIFAGYLSERQHITPQQAADELHAFAMQCLAVLEVEKELQLENIGKLYYLNSQTVTFEADANVNFCGESFGLDVFTVQPIYRSETYSEVKTVIEERQRAKNTPMTVVGEAAEEQPHRVTRANYKWYRMAAYSAAVATVLLLLGWGAEKSDSRLAAWNPFFFSSPNEFIAKHLNDKYNERETFIVETLKPVQADLTVLEKDAELVEKAVVFEDVKPLEEVKYYSVIGGSFDNIAAAERCAASFKAMGFEKAEVLPLNKKGNYRVEYEAVAGKDAAMARLEEIRKRYNESAWILVKKQ